ncbi:uncharacterized protein DS421_14g466700 [Arachis hypogaea]|nr:uncharacterized protein DS421_14g466700 [Arachis hypogaea]
MAHATARRRVNRSDAAVWLMQPRGLEKLRRRDSVDDANAWQGKARKTHFRPLTLLLTWAWIRLPFLALIPGNPRLFPIANRWRNWDRENYAYRYHSLAHYRRLLDDLQEGHFVWQAYGFEHIEPDVIPLDIRHHSVIWSATVPLISFKCVEWHASDIFRRQFGLIQGVPNQERDLGASHGKVLTGPKNQDWADTHSFWVMQ